MIAKGIEAGLLAAVLIGAPGVRAGHAAYDFFRNIRYPGTRRPDVELDRVEQKGGDAVGYNRRVVRWWPKKGVDVIDVPEGAPERTWTVRTPEMAPLVEAAYYAKWWPSDLKGKKQFKAHLIGFRGIGSREGDPFADKSKALAQGPGMCPAVVLRLGDGRKRCFTRGSFSDEDQAWILDLYEKEMARVRGTLEPPPEKIPRADFPGLGQGPVPGSRRGPAEEGDASVDARERHADEAGIAVPAEAVAHPRGLGRQNEVGTVRRGTLADHAALAAADEAVSVQVRNDHDAAQGIMYDRDLARAGGSLLCVAWVGGGHRAAGGPIWGSSMNMVALGIGLAWGLACVAYVRGGEGCDMAAPGAESRWSPEEAWTWYGEQPWLFGFNFVPSPAVNDTEMWQEETFDPATIDRELAWARALGFNSCRVFVQYIVWKQNPAGFKERFERFLSIAARHGLSVMPVLFDDCAFDAGRDPYPGKQEDPIPGMSNARWVPSPGLKRVVDRSAWPDLEWYVRDVVGAHRDDRRVLLWDLYNEPGNSGMGNKSLPLVEAVFEWARRERPSQPLTIGAWGGTKELTDRQVELSDIVSFHFYGNSEGMKGRIEGLKRHGRPLICTEWMARTLGSRYETELPLFRQERVGCYNWGLVNGRTQCQYPWGSSADAPEPALWFHDLLRADGSPKYPDEVAFIRRFVDAPGVNRLVPLFGLQRNEKRDAGREER